MVCDRCGKDIEDFAVRQEGGRGVLSFHSPCFQSFLKDGKLRGQVKTDSGELKDDWDLFPWVGYPLI